MEESPIDEPVSAPGAERSQFLTILCVLTWLGSAGTLLYGGAMLYVFMGLYWKLEGDAVANWGILSGVASLAGAVARLIGSIYMWKLRLRGFYIYLAGQLVPMLFIVYGMLLPGNADMTNAFWILLPIVFIILYASVIGELE